MKNVEKYKIYLIEQYRVKNNLTGRVVYNLFKNCNIFEYIETTFEAIHTLDAAEVLSDIEVEIKKAAKQQD
ncbi:MAG: DUF3791 domain-containing protein [Chitinispirillales bacterium]|jgi:hypothetical protein|nr:DUF3791 domain-containing protein [Chitinispirillales bacterium]